MIVLSPNTAMMIKKNMKDTMRKNVLRNPVIMMIHLLFFLGETATQTIESALITTSADVITIPVNVPSLMGKLYPDSGHYAVAVWL